jgi:hypothetical protein
MNKKDILVGMGLVAWGLVTPLFAVVEAPLDTTPDVLPIQSKARPFGLDIVGPVYAAGSDTAAANFQTETLPVMQKLLQVTLGESKAFNDLGAYSLDPTRLKLVADSLARVYFIGEGAGYRNTLGFNTLAYNATAKTPAITGDAMLIFPDASSSISSLSGGASDKGVRTVSAPLLAGDFVDLGKFSAGSILDFFLIADGASGGKNTYTASAERNPDLLQHVVAFALPDSPFLLIGFEDMLRGGDRDYNDLLFAVDIGAINVKNLVSAPEPTFWVVLLGCLAVVLWRSRKKDCAPLTAS